MNIKRYYINQDELNSLIIFSEYNHIVKVMRQKVDDEIILIIGDGFFYYAKIEKIFKDSIKFLIEKKVKDNSASKKINVTAYLGLLKGDNMDFAVQKLSELSINKVIPFCSTNTVVKKETAKIERFKKIAVESAKQCGRSKIMAVEDVIEFEELKTGLNCFDVVLFAYEGEYKLSVKNAIKDLENVKNIAFIIGSEGGFTESEAKSFKPVKNLKTVSLGKNILRAETAAINMAAVIKYEFEI